MYATYTAARERYLGFDMRNTPNRQSAALPKRPSLLNAKSLWGLLFVAALVWSLHSAGLFQRELVNVGGWTLVWRFLVAATHPDLSREILQLALDSTLKTLAFAVCGTFFSVLIGLVGGVLCSEVWWQSSGGSGVALNAPWLLVR